MKKGYFSVGTAALLSLGLFTSQTLAQDFCSTTTHSGQSARTNGTRNGEEYQTISKIGDYDYELWYRGGGGASSATFYSDGSMECSAKNSDDYLCRSGLSFECDNQQKKCFKTYDQLGHIYADFKVSLSGQQNIGYSFIGIYGWSRDPVIEYYIVDNWASQYKPGGTGWGWTKKGEYTVDGAKYEAWTHTQVEQWSVDGVMTFEQYYGVRESARSCGTIDITKHFQEWAKLGMNLGKMYEAKVLGEVGNGSGTASCNFDFPVSRVYISDGTTPTSSASTNPTSSATSQEATASLPGTIEMESFETNGGDEVTIYGDVVGEVKPGAYLEWTVDVANAGIYSFEVLAARADEEGRESTISLLIDGTTVGAVSVLTDTDWSDLHYKTFSGTTSTSIASGKHTLRVSFDDGYVNVDNIKFTAQGTESLASNIRMSLNNDKSVQVFDMQGRNLGRVSVAAGASLQDALFARLHKSGIYLVKQGSKMTRVRVTR